MGEKTGILWTNHTFSPVWGCKKVSESCRNCYAKRDATRYGLEELWTTDKRRTFPQKHWDEPLKWNAKAEKDAVIRSVFCGSMCDIFEDNPTTNKEREKLWPLIEATPHLLWLLLTKRPENISRFTYYDADFPPVNVAMGITAEDQENMDKRWPILQSAWSGGSTFISIEPMLGEIHLPGNAYYALDWCIVGSESGHNRRETKIEWVKEIRDECIENGVLLFIKQLDIDGVLTKQPEVDGRKWLQTLLTEHTSLY